ncbi:MAG: aminotransferase class V-fold PLP-dependent enzyme [Bacteroidota bacterium]
MQLHLHSSNDIDRRTFISNIGKGLGLATLSSAYLTGIYNEMTAMTKKIDHLTPDEAAKDEDFWFHIQQSFSVSRSMINLNNGGVSPSPRIVTEALIRYQWQQEDATAYTMWQIMQPQVETIRTGLAGLFGCDPEEIAITRNASESLEILLMGLDLRNGDEILTTTQDYPRMLTTLRQREQREGISLKLVSIPVPSESKQEIIDAFEKGISPKTKVILMCHQINLTGQILPVKEICTIARNKGIEVIVDGAHSFAQFAFKNNDIQCDYFGTSLHKWLYAPKGTGMLYVKKGKIAKIWPLMAADKKQVTDVRKFEEIGTNSIAVKLAIGEALSFHNGIGSERKEARLRYLSRHWMNNLKSLKNIRFNTSFNDEFSCALANFDLENVEIMELYSYLFSKHKIITTPIVHEEFKGLRITPNLYTTLGELDHFCEIISDISVKGIPTK